MPQKKNFLTRRYSWPVIVSVAFHGSLIAAMLYASLNRSATVQQAPQPITMTLVAPAPVDAAPAPQPESAPTPPQPEPEPEPEIQPPEPVPVPVAVPEPKPQPKPKPKPQPKPKPVKKKENPKPVEEPKESPFTSNEPTKAPNNAPVRQAPVASAPVSGPLPLSRTQPEYPARAFALRVEGRVKVQFDIDGSGRVSDIRILSAEPKNMFERDIRQAMRKWRYEENKPSNNLVVTIVFKINGGAAME
ncbi:TonB system transport protein TonB [Lonsdalea britannica]|uniref:TonB system transport protein TonB n=1 Tax=Lonsdalea britannica TaxID=1082704 RepID=UPI0026EFED83|nr:TonB system transport protein TonB [Lonsdalea britannica]